MAESPDDQTDKIPLFKPSALPPRRKLSTRGLRAKKVVNRYSLMAGGIGMIPSPLVGQVAVGVLLVKLLKDMCEIYGVSFSDHQIKILVTAILGGAHAEWISHYLLKYIRGSYVLGANGAIVLRPAVSGIMVYYIGKLFLGHFESGAWIRIKEVGLRQFA